MSNPYEPPQSEPEPEPQRRKNLLSSPRFRFWSGLGAVFLGVSILNMSQTVFLQRTGFQFGNRGLAMSIIEGIAGVTILAGAIGIISAAFGSKMRPFKLPCHFPTKEDSERPR